MSQMAFLKEKAHVARNHECFLEKAFSERGVPQQENNKTNNK